MTAFGHPCAGAHARHPPGQGCALHSDRWLLPRSARAARIALHRRTAQEVK